MIGISLLLLRPGVPMGEAAVLISIGQDLPERPVRRVGPVAPLQNLRKGLGVQAPSVCTSAFPSISSNHPLWSGRMGDPGNQARANLSFLLAGIPCRVSDVLLSPVSCGSEPKTLRMRRHDSDVPQLLLPHNQDATPKKPPKLQILEF